MKRAATARYRWGIASRVLAAVLGGYTVASLCAAVLALALPHIAPASRADGVLIASLLGFLFYTAVALWVFGARSATRAWAGLGAAALVCGALLLVL